MSLEITRFLNTLEGSTVFPPRLIKVTVGQVEDKFKVFWVKSDILCGQSKFFRAALNGTFLEAQTNSVALPEDDPEIFGALLCWMHGRGEIFELSPTLRFVLNLLELADKLMIQGDLGIHIADHNTHALSLDEYTASDIRRAYAIPGARPIGRICAKNSVEDYLVVLQGDFDPSGHGNEYGNFEFVEELEQVPGYAADLLGFVADAIKSGSEYKHKGKLYFKNPSTKKIKRVQLS